MDFTFILKKFNMSLFVGNISKNIDQRQLEKAFISFGKCTIDKRVIICYLFLYFCRLVMLSLNLRMKLMPKMLKISYQVKISVA